MGSVMTGIEHIQTYIVKLDNVRMPHFLENRDLSINSLQIGMVFNLLFLEDFYCNLYNDEGKLKINISDSHRFGSMIKKSETPIRRQLRI